MSFKCDFCRSVADAGTPMHRVPVKTRPKEYHAGKSQLTTGQEIVVEGKMCDTCWRKGETGASSKSSNSQSV